MARAKHIRQTIAITEAQRDALAKVADAEGLAVSDIARRAIALYIRTLAEQEQEQ